MVSEFDPRPQLMRKWKKMPITWASTSNPTFAGALNIEESGYVPRRIIGWEMLGDYKSHCAVVSLFIPSANKTVYAEVRTYRTPTSLTANSIDIHIEYEKVE